MAPPDSATVLGRFGSDSLPHPGGTSYFLRRGSQYVVRTTGPDGKAAEYPIRYTFGFKPLQQYLTEFPGGRMQALPTAWDPGRKAWFHLAGPDSSPAPDDWLHWTRDANNWNGMCADCHSTGLRRGYDASRGTFKTTWTEIDVSCETCHGPAASHVAWAKSGAFRRLFQPAAAKAEHGFRFNHMGQGAPAEIAACARCHARRSALHEDFGYAKDFLDEYAPQLLSEGVYHADGQIQDEVYEYGSFLQSKMYHNGIKCSDCHDPHGLKTRRPGNALCTGCHEAARFDAVAHHRHAQGGPGGLCVECHMPRKTYMRVDPRRDHSLRVPRPDLSVKYGTPNACSQCHADSGAAWAAAWVVKWHGPDRKPHFSDLLAKGRSAGQGADTALSVLAAGAEWPAIARASALEILSNYMGALARAALARGAQDREPLVRLAAAMAADRLPDQERMQAAAPLLRDSLRAIRAAAAGALIPLSPVLPDSLRADYARGLAEHREALGANAVFPGGRFNLGRYQEARGDIDSAAHEYRMALAIDSRFIPPRMNLANLHARQGRPDSAEAQFRAVLAIQPAFAEASYSLGLLLAEQGRDDSAASQLALASSGLPGDARIPYNLGLLQQKLGRSAEAAKSLRRSLAVGGEMPDVLYALAWLEARRGLWREAEAVLQRLRLADPGFAGAEGLASAVAQRKPLR